VPTLALSPATHPREARNLLWLRYSTRGPDLDGRQRPWTVREIAAVWGAGEQTVRDGIAWAKGLTRALDDAAIPPL